MWALTSTDGDGLVGTNIYDNETAFISAVRDQLNDLRTTSVSAVLRDGSKLDEKALGAKYGLESASSIATRRQRKPTSGRGDNRGFRAFIVHSENRVSAFSCSRRTCRIEQSTVCGAACFPRWSKAIASSRPSGNRARILSYNLSHIRSGMDLV